MQNQRSQLSIVRAPVVQPVDEALPGRPTVSAANSREYPGESAPMVTFDAAVLAHAARELLLAQPPSPSTLRFAGPGRCDDRAVTTPILRHAALVLYARKQSSFGMEEVVGLCEAECRRFRGITVDWRGYFDRLAGDCLLVPAGEGSFAFCHDALQEYLVAQELVSEIGAASVTRAIEEYFRSGGWWEEVLILYAAMKRNVLPLIDDLHRHLAGGITRAGVPGLLLRLLRRWLEVADLTPLGELNPRGSVARALSQLGPPGVDVERLRAVWGGSAHA